MGMKVGSLTQEDRIKLLEEYGTSGLSLTEYAQGKGIGLSTLHKWSSQLKVPLLRRSKNSCRAKSKPEKAISESISKGRKYKKDDVFLRPPPCEVSFVDITSQMDGSSLSLTQQVTQSVTSCGLEIHLPTGVILKLEKVPFHHVWGQAVEWVQCLKNHAH